MGRQIIQVLLVSQESMDALELHQDVLNERLDCPGEESQTA